MNILIRTDSSQKIGHGHLFRCYSIASYLRTLGHNVVFALRQTKDNGESFLKSNGIEVISWEPTQLNKFPQAQDAQEMLKAVGSKNFDCVIVDHYELCADWEKEVREKFSLIFAIDDLDRIHSCDYLLDPTLGKTLENYKSSLVNKKLIVGSDFAVLRQEFIAAREQAFIRRNNCDSIEKIFVNFGGGDSKNLPIKVLNLLSENSKTKDCETTILANPKSENYSDLAQFCNSIPHYKLIEPTDRISDLMLSADLAIGSAGTSAYERASLGLPSIMVKLAENQNDNLKNFDQKGLAKTLENWQSERFGEQFNKTINQIFENPTVYSNLVEQCFKLVSPVGLLLQLSEIFGGNLLRIRTAKLEDVTSVYNWQKFPGARKFSREKSIPTYNQHVQWFENSLKMNSRHMFLLEASSVPLGFLRVDESEKTEVSLLISHAFYGYGLAKLALNHLREKFQVQDLYAYIESENKASIRVFTSCGYKPLESENWYVNSKKIMPSE